MKQLRKSTWSNRVHLASLLGAALTASVGCSDDGVTTPTEVVDGGASTASSGSDTSATSGNGSDTSSQVATSSETSDVVDPTDVTTTPEDSSQTTEVSSSTNIATSAVSTPDSGTSDSVTSNGTAASTSEVAVSSTEDEDGAIAPPDDMTVIQDFDAVAGFPDGSDNVTVDRAYGDSMMSLDIAFSSSGQQAGVNFNYPGGSGELCGYDFVARIRMTSGTLDGGVQLRVWSDAWAQFSSQITSLPPIGLGEWIDFRLTWEQAVANDDPDNGILNIHAINAVGLEFMTFGDASAIHVDVDWIGLVPSDTPCPSESGPDAGETSTATPGETSMPTVDSGVETGTPTDIDASAGETSAVDTSTAMDAGAGSMALDASP